MTTQATPEAELDSTLGAYIAYVTARGELRASEMRKAVKMLRAALPIADRVAADRGVEDRSSQALVAMMRRRVTELAEGPKT